jgi:hypothetical protein
MQKKLFAYYITTSSIFFQMEYNLISTAWNVQNRHACLENTSVKGFPKWSTVNFSILSYALNDSLEGSFLERILHGTAGRLRPNLERQTFIMLMFHMFSRICTILYK